MKWNQILCYKLVGCYHVFFNLDVTMLQPNIVAHKSVHEKIQQKILYRYINDVIIYRAVKFA